jgi:hypothetical protein
MIDRAGPAVELAGLFVHGTSSSLQIVADTGRSRRRGQRTPSQGSSESQVTSPTPATQLSLPAEDAFAVAAVLQFTSPTP